MIYDKRQEIMQQQKLGCLPIWNAALADLGLPPLNLADRDVSQVWRFELRLGTRQLRNRWEMRSWMDLREKLGDAFAEFCTKLRCTRPTSDSNRARWPTYQLWEAVEGVVCRSLEHHRTGVHPDEVKEVNRTEHWQMLDRQILGLFVSRAAASGVAPGEFEAFVESHTASIVRLSGEHSRPISERIVKAAERDRFR